MTAKQRPIHRPGSPESAHDESLYAAFAAAQFRVLKDYMALAKLNTYSRVVTLANGVVITCKKSFSREDIFISVPRVEGDRAPTHTESIVVICLTEFSKKLDAGGDVILDEITGEPETESPVYTYTSMNLTGDLEPITASPDYYSWFTDDYSSLLPNGVSHIDTTKAEIIEGAYRTGRQDWQDGKGNFLCWDWASDRYSWGACSDHIHAGSSTEITAPGIIRGAGVRTLSSSDGLVTEKNIIVSFVDGTFFELRKTEESPDTPVWKKITGLGGIEYTTKPQGIQDVKLPVFFTFSGDNAYCYYDLYWPAWVDIVVPPSTFINHVPNIHYHTTHIGNIYTFTFTTKELKQTDELGNVRTYLYSEVTEVVTVDDVAGSLLDGGASAYQSVPSQLPVGSYDVGWGGQKDFNYPVFCGSIWGGSKELLAVDATTEMRKLYRGVGVTVDQAIPTGSDYNTDGQDIWIVGKTWFQSGDYWYLECDPARTKNSYSGTWFECGDAKLYSNGRRFFIDASTSYIAGLANITVAAADQEATTYNNLPVRYDLRRNDPFICVLSYEVNYAHKANLEVGGVLVKSYDTTMSDVDTLNILKNCTPAVLKTAANDPNIQLGYVFELNDGIPDETLFVSWRYQEHTVVTFCNKKLKDDTYEDAHYFKSIADSSTTRFFTTSKQYFVTGIINVTMEK